MQARRRVRSAGLLAGGALGASAAALGAYAGIFDGTLCCSLLAAGGATWLAATMSYEESASPLAEDYYEVQEVRGKGRGLFCARPIVADTYLFDYGGERLSEQAFFERYPDGQGPYAARITGTTYIDGASEGCGLAPIMNHACESATVRKATQIFGPNTAIHFYALRDLAQGDELTCNYGAAYWSASDEPPIET